MDVAKEVVTIKRLKGRASEDHAVINMLKSSKTLLKIFYHYYPEMCHAIWDILKKKKSSPSISLM